MFSLDQPVQDNDTVSQTPEPHHRIPSVFLIGAAKSATTTLAHWLTRHPKINFGKMKELNFFSHEASFRKGFVWYSSQFSAVRDHQLALDASTGYTRWPQNPGTAGRIHLAAPCAKLIYVMRHPVDRAYSHYIHRWSKECHPGKPFTVPFEEYVKTDPMCLESSNYRAQIEAYLDFFAPDSLHCLFTEDMKTQPSEVMRRIFQFLDVQDGKSYRPFATVENNSSEEFLESCVRISLTGRLKSIPVLGHLISAVPPRFREKLYTTLRKSPWGDRVFQTWSPIPMSDNVRQQMIERFAESNKWVAKFTGHDLSHWNK